VPGLKRVIKVCYWLITSCDMAKSSVLELDGLLKGN